MIQWGVEPAFLESLLRHYLVLALWVSLQSCFGGPFGTVPLLLRLNIVFLNLIVILLLCSCLPGALMGLAHCVVPCLKYLSISLSCLFYVGRFASSGHVRFPYMCSVRHELLNVWLSLMSSVVGCLDLCNSKAVERIDILNNQTTREKPKLENKWGGKFEERREICGDC